MQTFTEKGFSCNITFERCLLYDININKDSKKYLRFIFQEKCYQFNVLPFELCLCTAPLTFTEIMKPVIAYLRESGFTSVIYLDDFLCIGNSYIQCL